MHFITFAAAAFAGPGGFTVGADLDYAVPPPVAIQGVGKASIAGGLRAGYQIAPLILVINPEVGVSYRRFETAEDDPPPDLRGPVTNVSLIRAVVGARLAMKGLVRPGVFGHVGMGRSGGEGIVPETNITADGGLLLEVAVPHVAFGVHAGYELSGMNWSNAALVPLGGHATVTF